MTGLGKLLVFVNLFVAVALHTWATSLYANRIDWVDRKTDAGLVKGQITQLSDEIKRLSTAITDAQAGYGAQDRAVADATTARANRQQRFAARLAQARQGNFSVQRVDPKSALTDLSAADTQLPKFTGPDGQPLRGFNAVQADFDAEIQKSTLAANEIDRLRKAHDATSAQIKDLDQKVAAQALILKNLGDEAKLLADLRVNWDEQLRVLQQRRKQLEARLTAVGGAALTLNR